MITVCKSSQELFDALIDLATETRGLFGPRTARDLRRKIESFHGHFHGARRGSLTAPPRGAESLPLLFSVGGLFWAQYASALAADAKKIGEDIVSLDLAHLSEWFKREFHGWLADMKYQEFIYATGRVPVGGWR